MARLSVWLAGLFVLGFIILGAVQTLHLPRTELAGAVTLEHSQQDINTCVKSCMRGCVAQPDDEQPCLAQCEPHCGA